MTKTYLLGGFIALLLIVGAGCEEKTEDNSMQTKDAEELSMTNTIDTSKYTNLFQGDEGEDEMNSDDSNLLDGFELRAKAMGDRKVHFEWKVSDDIGDKAEAYRFARGTEKDPTYPSNWWWERGPAHRELEWEELPTGPAHFRVCAVVNDECEVYSNDVEVVVE